MTEFKRKNSPKPNIKANCSFFFFFSKTIQNSFLILSHRKKLCTRKTVTRKQKCMMYFYLSNPLFSVLICTFPQLYRSRLEHLVMHFLSGYKLNYWDVPCVLHCYIITKMTIYVHLNSKNAMKFLNYQTFVFVNEFLRSKCSFTNEMFENKINKIVKKIIMFFCFTSSFNI